MKREDKGLLIELLVTQMNYWVIFAVVASIYNLMNIGIPNMMRWVPVSLLPYGFYLVRRRWDGLLPFTLTHIMTAIILVAIPSENLVIKVLFTIYLIGCVVESLAVRITKEDRRNGIMIPPVAVGIVFIAALVQHLHGTGNIDLIFILCIVAYIIMYFIYYYMDRYEVFLKMNQRNSGYMPRRAMFRSGIKIVSAYALVSGVLLYLIADPTLANTITGFFKSIVWSILWLLFHKGGESVEGYVQENQATQNEMGIQELMTEEATEPSFIWTILEWFFSILVLLLIVALFILLICKCVITIKEIFGRKIAKDANIMQDEKQDIHEKCEKKTIKTNKKHVLYFRTTEEKVRNYYKKTINSKWKLDNSPEKYTARECCEIVEEKQLREIYEKARYSTQSCTEEDLKRMKESRH